MAETHSEKPIQLELILYTAVDWEPGEDAGVGIVQRAKCTTTGAFQDELIPRQELKCTIRHNKYATQDVDAARRAQILGAVHALDMAQGTFDRGCSKAVVRLQKVTVLAHSQKIFTLVKDYVTSFRKMLKTVGAVNADDRLVMKKFAVRLRRLFRRGLEVAIAHCDRKDEDGKMAEIMAKQMGDEARIRHRQLQQTHDKSSGEEQEVAGEDQKKDL